MPEQTYRIAPPGFTPEQWETFMEEGFLVIEDALSEDEIGYYLEAIDRCAAADPKFNSEKFYGPGNVVERSEEHTSELQSQR